MKEPIFGPSVKVEIDIWENQNEKRATEELEKFQDVFQKIISGEYEGQNINPEFLARLFPYKLVWEDFDEWHRYFKEINYFPRMWGGLEGKQPEISEDSVEYLKGFAELSLPARKILVNTNYYKSTKQQTKKLYDFKRQSQLSPEKFDTAFNELRGNFLNPRPSIEDRLRLLRVKDLKPILEEFDLKKSGRKNELVDRLAKEVSEDKLKEFLTSEAKEDLVVSAKWLPKKDSDAIKYHDQKINLLSHTTNSLRATQQTLDRAIEHGNEKLEIKTYSDTCPVCSEKEGMITVSKKNLDKLPPFYPGCRCSVNISLESLGGTEKNTITKVSSGSKQQGGCLSTLSLMGLMFFVLIFWVLF